ncbi:MAG: replication protein [Nitrospirota bacterium]
MSRYSDYDKLLKGFTMIKNNMIMEALARVNFTARQSRVLWIIIRHTEGFGKPTSKLSYRQIAWECGMTLRHIQESVQELVDMNIIQTSKTKFKPFKTEFKINMDYKSWTVEFHYHNNELKKEIEASPLYMIKREVS